MDAATSIHIACSVQSEPLSLDHAVAQVQSPTVGGIAIFVGVVRDHDAGRGVVSLTYSAHPSAQAELEQCAHAVAAGHQVTAVSVSHRVGTLEIGEPAVVVAVGAAHRAAALECCRETIDRLKAEVPIWKEQHYLDGSIDWVGM